MERKRSSEIERERVGARFKRERVKGECVNESTGNEKLSLSLNNLIQRFYKIK